MFDEKTADAICARIAEGEPLRQICRDEAMPAWRTVYDWLAENKEFAARIARARESGYDAIAHDCLEIADYAREDSYIDANGNARTDSEVIARSKLRVETRLKLLAKWDPKRYGEKVQTEHSGAVAFTKLTREIVDPSVK